MTSGVNEKGEDGSKPAAVLLDNLKDPEASLRLEAMAGIPKIAEAMGPERTREELLPFLTETIEDEDEVLQALALGLGETIDLVGGLEHMDCLLPPLEILCSIDDRKVREAAVGTMTKIVSRITSGEADEEARVQFGLTNLFPLVFRLAGGHWYTSRVSACNLLAPSCRCIPSEPSSEIKEEIAPRMIRGAIMLHRKLARDEKVTVRRAAAECIGELGESTNRIDPSVIENEIFPIFRELCDDEQDSVRILVIRSSPAVLKLLPESLRDNITVPVLRSLSQDTSWRVRYQMADDFVRIADSVSTKVVRDEILPAFLSLLKDTDSEVRTIMATRSGDATKRIIHAADEDPVISGVDIAIRDILPVLQELVSDPSEHVRAALASNVMSLAPELGQEFTVRELMEMVLILLKDESPTVRLNVISSLDSVSFVMGMRGLADELLPAIVDLAEDSNWRIRLAIIEHIPLLAQQLGHNIFEEEMRLSDICLTWLGDCVWSIREAAIYTLKNLTTVFGQEWAETNIVPQIIELFTKSPNYLYRVTSLYAMGILGEVVARDVVENEFLHLIAHSAISDPVPNVRFSAAKCLDSLIPHVREEFHKAVIRPCLENVLDGKESDGDVLDSARAALAKVEAL